VPAGKQKSIKKRHGIPLSRNDGVKMTAEEVTAMLHDA